MTYLLIFSLDSVLLIMFFSVKMNYSMSLLLLSTFLFVSINCDTHFMNMNETHKYF